MLKIFLRSVLILVVMLIAVSTATAEEPLTDVNDIIGTVTTAIEKPLNDVGDITGFYSFDSSFYNCISNGTWIEGGSAIDLYSNTIVKLVYVKTQMNKKGGTFDIYKIHSNENTIIGRLFIGPDPTTYTGWIILKHPTNPDFRINGSVVFTLTEYGYTLTSITESEIRGVLSNKNEIQVCNVYVEILTNFESELWW